MVKVTRDFLSRRVKSSHIETPFSNQRIGKCVKVRACVDMYMEVRKDPAYARRDLCFHSPFPRSLPGEGGLFGLFVPRTHLSFPSSPTSPTSSSPGSSPSSKPQTPLSISIAVPPPREEYLYSRNVRLRVRASTGGTPTHTLSLLILTAGKAFWRVLSWVRRGWGFGRMGRFRGKYAPGRREGRGEGRGISSSCLTLAGNFHVFHPCAHPVSCR